MTDQPADTPKRRVKNPETFRERAIKATTETDKVTKTARLKRVGGKVTKPVLSPVGRMLRKLASIQPFKFILKVLRWIGRIIVPSYIRNSWKELRQVSWPSLKQSRQLTFAVLLFAIVFGALIAIVDYGLDKLFKNILLK
jgi:preprotein translocase SecE subunit